MAGHKRRSEILAVGTHLAKTCPSTQVGQRETRKLDNNSTGTVKSFPSSSSQEHNATGLVKDKTGEGVFEHPSRTEDHEKSVLDTQQIAAKNPAGEKLTYTSPPSPLLDLSSPPPCPPIDHRLESLGRYQMSNCWEVLTHQCPTIADTFYSFIHSVTLHKISIPDDHKRRLEVLLLRIHKLSPAEATREAQQFLNLSGKYEDLSLPVYIPLEEKKCSLLPTRLSLSPQAEEYPVPIPRPLKPPIPGQKPRAPPNMKLSTSSPGPATAATRKASAANKRFKQQQGGHNVHNAVAQELNRAHQDIQGQAEGLREAIQAQKEEADETKKTEKKKKDYENAIAKLPTRYARNLALYLLSFWGKGYYSDSPALREFICRLQSFGLDIVLSGTPDIILGMLLQPDMFPDQENGIVHILNTSLSVDPASEESCTPFYDQRIPSSYTRWILTKYPRLAWTDSEQGAFCSLPTQPAWIDIPRFGMSVLPVSFPGKLMPGRLLAGAFFTDTLIRRLIKPNRTFSEMGFSANIQTILAHECRPTYCEWQYDLLNAAVLSGYHDNALMYNIRTSYGDRRHTYDDCTIEACTGVKLAGYGFSFAGVQEMANEVVQPKVEEAQQFVSEQIAAVSGRLNRHDKPDKDPEDKPEEPGTQQGVEQQIEVIEEAPAETFLDSVSENLRVFKDKVDEQANRAMACLTPINIPGDFWQSLIVFTDSLRSKEDLYNDIANWWTTNVYSIQDMLVENLLESLGPVLATWFDMLTQTRLGMESAVQIFFVGRMLWVKLFEQLEGLIANQLSMPHAVYTRMKTYFITRSEIIATLMERDEAAYIPNVLFNSNYCPGMRESIPIAKQLVKERTLIGADPGFYSEPMCVSWQECKEITDHGPVSLEEYGRELPYDETRISITLSDHYQSKPGKFSELHYGLFIQQGRCYGQNYLLTCTKKRLGRSIESPEESAIDKFRRVARSVRMPQVEIINEEPCVKRSEYVKYVENMPSSKQKRHLDYFDSLSNVNNPDKDKDDATFVKADEMIANPKGRGIINPPPSIFYDLVIGITMIKRALKRKTFNLVYDEECSIYFTYGADMTSDEKSAWYKKAMQPVSEKPTAYILIGGDDNATILHYKGDIIAWESDVTACDQSHNRPLVTVMSEVIAMMGMIQEWIDKLLKSYSRKIRVPNFTVIFLEWQLHTGHPQTSTCNSLLVGLIGIYLLIIFFRRLLRGERYWPSDDNGVKRIEADFDFETKRLGMIWKNQIMLEVGDLTFHKGCWMPCQNGLYQWMPLPSCLWKAFKIRTDQKLTNKDLLLRLAFNLYQKLLNPNMSFVQSICEKQFKFIISKVLRMKGEPHYAFQQFLVNVKKSASMTLFLETQYNKAGEMPVLDGKVNRGPQWDHCHEVSFCQSRYGCSPDDLMELLEAGSWDGSFGVLVSPFLQRAIFRDYMATHSEFSEQIDNHLESVPGRLLEYL